MVGPSKTFTFGSVGCQFVKSFETFVGLQEQLFGVTLPIPSLDFGDDLSRLSFFKKFCSGLLEGDKSHPWISPLSKLSSDNRWSVGFSLFLFRKVLPSPESDLRSYLNKMSTPRPLDSEDFLDYVRREVPKMFKHGWDATLYPSACLSATLPVSSCVEQGRDSGGSRALAVGCDFREAGGIAGGICTVPRDSYVLDVLTRVDTIPLFPSRVCSVEKGGKSRVVSTPCFNMNYLRPLHTAMYNRISRLPWLLRGQEKPSRFHEFVRKEGEIFVSGDYESATDNLSIEIQSEILKLILDSTTSVPEAIRDLAMRSTRMDLEVHERGRVFRATQARGQLMGNLLSFPLLCIVNYLAFKYLTPKGTPVKINGDDIVFRSTPDVAARWKQGVSKSGLTLSPGKTLTHSRYFSLNSSLFKAGFNKCVLLPFFRSTAFGFRSDCGGVDSLNGRFYSFCPGFQGKRRSELRCAFLKENRKYVDASRRSLTRGLGLNVRYDEMVRCGLWGREGWYLSLEVERPLPPKLSQFEVGQLEGFVLHRVERLTKEMRLASRLVASAFVERAWTESKWKVGTDYESLVREGCGDYLAWLHQSCSRRRARLLGLSVRNLHRFLSVKLSAVQSRLAEYKKSKKSVWLPSDFRTSELKFQAASC